jgi:sortase A
VYEAHWLGGETPFGVRRGAYPAQVPSKVVRRAVAAFGRILVTLGLLVLLFVAYELWGTGLITARAQSHLKHQFQQELQQVQDAPTITVPTKPGKRPSKPIVNPRVLIAPPEGNAIGLIKIPKIGVNWWFVEGVQLTDLAKGPGHYPGTPLPGQVGNAAIAGHRTTHGAPFFRVNELNPGDKIHITTLAGKYTYVVTQKPFAVDPTDYAVVANTPTATLTLTSCNPRYSAAQRIIIKARLVKNQSSPVHKPPLRINGKRVKQPPRKALATGLEGQSNSVVPSFAFGGVVLVVGMLWWWLYRRWRHPLTLFLGAIPFLIVLTPFYVYLERALPNGY